MENGGVLEHWPQAVGLILGAATLAALVWVVQRVRLRSERERERVRVWRERLAATDDAFLAECSVEKGTARAALALGLRRVIVDCYGEPPPVGADDVVEVRRLSRTFLDDGFDPLDFWLRMELASKVRIRKEQWHRFLESVTARPVVRVREMVGEVVRVAW